jgi:glycosyltransferase involved in cell wall biosynthesis
VKILFFGDLAATGFGTVTNDLGRRLIELGEDVRFVSLNETPTLGEPFASRTLSVLSIEASTEQENFIARLMRGETDYKLWNGQAWGDWQPDAAIILGDFAAARIFVGQHLDAFVDVPTFHYVPIEGVELPPMWNELWSIIKPVAMSRFGAREIAKVVGYEPPMIYHGVDTEAFYPVSKERPIIISAPDRPDMVLTSKKACRSVFVPGLKGMNDYTHPAFREVWLLRTDRHMPRKRYPAMLRTLGPVLQRNPKARMVIHCRSYDQGGYLWDDISKLSEPVQKQVYLTEMLGVPSGVPRPVLNALYNACDLYVSTSAEGFGLTVAEAVATGLPAVGIDYSAVPEVIGPAGVTVPVGYLFDNEYSHRWASVDEEAMARAVEFLVTHQQRRLDLGRKGPAHVADMFQWDRAALDFRELLHGSVVTRQAA